MRSEHLDAYGKPASIVFNNYGTMSCGGVVYTCKVVTDYYSHADMEMKCLALVCMN